MAHGHIRALITILKQKIQVASSGLQMLIIAVPVKSDDKPPTERSVDFGLDLVAMILRPDGFGNLQGDNNYRWKYLFVRVHNDADEPGVIVIAQFGGERPPFLRVQPKLKVDIEL